MTKEELLTTLKKDAVEDTEILQAIQFYLRERKNVDVTIQRPVTMLQVMLMHQAYGSVLNYYSKEL